MYRLERVVETMRAALNALATVAPEWMRTIAPDDWVKRYGGRAEESRFPDADRDREALFDTVAADGYRLLDAVRSETAPEWLRQIPAVEILRVVWVQTFQIVDGRLHQRDKNDRPPSARQIESPYEAEARFARKRETTWLG